MNEQSEKYFLEEMSLSEKLAFFKKLESDKELQEEFSRYKNIDALFALTDNVVDKSDTIRNYKIFIRRMKQKVIRRFTLRALGAAAAIGLLIFSIHLYHVYNYQSLALVASETSLFIPAGQRVSITLEDGTVVWLNAQSRLTYPTAFVGSERRVSVEGEAYFEVAKNAEKPFIVTSQGIEMKVLGTSFNVYSYPGENVSRISLLEGSLQIYKQEAPENAVILRPREEVIIEDNKMSVSMIPSNNYFLWKDGIYSFEDETLANVFKKLELYYDIKIEVKDPAILNWKYTVKFRQRDGIDEILRLMREIHTFHIEKDNENNRIIVNR